MIILWVETLNFGSSMGNMIETILKMDYTFSAALAKRKDRVIDFAIYVFSGRLLFLIGTIDFITLELFERVGIKFNGLTLIVILILEWVLVHYIIREYLVIQIASNESSFKKEKIKNKKRYTAVCIVSFLIAFVIFFVVGVMTFEGYLE